MWAIADEDCGRSDMFSRTGRRKMFILLYSSRWCRRRKLRKRVRVIRVRQRAMKAMRRSKRKEKERSSSLRQMI